VKRSHLIILALAVLADVAFALWYFGFFTPPPVSSNAVSPPQFRASLPREPGSSP